MQDLVFQVLFDLLFHLQAGFEDYYFPRRDGYNLIGARVSYGTALSLLDLKYAEIA